MEVGEMGRTERIRGEKGSGRRARTCWAAVFIYKSGAGAGDGVEDAQSVKPKRAGRERHLGRPAGALAPGQAVRDSGLTGTQLPRLPGSQPGELTKCRKPELSWQRAWGRSCPTLFRYGLHGISASDHLQHTNHIKCAYPYTLLLLLLPVPPN